MKPVAVGLDKLQSEKQCFYGCLIPTLLVTQEALSTSSAETNDLRLRHCMPLLTAVVSGFERRFHKFLRLTPDVTDAVLASVSHPFFKLRWVSLFRGFQVQDRELLKADIKQKLQTAVRRIAMPEDGNSDKKMTLVMMRMSFLKQWKVLQLLRLPLRSWKF